MFKTLAAKAIIPVLLTTIGFVVVCSIILFANMESDRIKDNIFHADDISSVLLKATRYAMLKDDREALLNIVTSVNDEKLVEHVRIFNKKGVIIFSGNVEEIGSVVNKEAEGCMNCHSPVVTLENLGPMEQARRYKLDSGLPVLATTKAIYNEESCYTADCHHHNELQSILGTLDVGLSELPLQESLSTMGKRLVAFTIMLTILVIGGVAALLQLNVVAPLRKLTDYLHAVSVGDDSGEAPELSGELKTIVYAIRRIKKSIDKHD